ncbi:MAG: TRAP transporter small permease subunit [Gammaproteobacteria bacterium]|nr:TRAP transporter small permease subunit [Gammaproteobacteria bacterium]
MNGFISFIDSLSTWVGKAFAWCILVLTLGTTYEVVMRYVFRAPTTWAFDISYIMYGALFMMAGAYTLSRDGHVRGDVIYRLWKPRAQAWLELALYFLFFFPGMLALIYAGIDYAQESWSYMPYGPDGPRGEISINSPAGVPVSPLKTLLPLAAFFCLLQGVAEVCRCFVCLRTGVWPERMQDVEETEVALMELMRKREQELEHRLHLDEIRGDQQEQRSEEGPR